MKTFLLAPALIVAALLFTNLAHADCLPSSAGGTGGALKVTARADATIYTWRCPAGDGQFIVARPEWSPTVPPSQAALRVELERLRVMAGYARDPEFLNPLAAQILAGQN